MVTVTEVPTEFATITWAAARAGRCEDTIRTWLAAGRLTPFRLLNRTVVKIAELDALLAAKSPADEPTPPAAG